MSGHALQVTPVPAFSDNYLWMITAGDGAAAVVDPGDAAPVLEWLSAENKSLAHILVTHHHADHIGGVERLKNEFPDAVIFASDDPRIPLADIRVGEGARVELGDIGAEFEVLEVPGHTSHHIAYHGHGLLFCGDTLFAGGCGRVFCGSMKDLHASLQRLAGLPDDTLVYCAHEYTLSNLDFALQVEPGNQALQRRKMEAIKLREQGQPTVPSTISLERLTNPFLRTDQPDVTRAAQAKKQSDNDEPWRKFETLRLWKDGALD